MKAALSEVLASDLMRLKEDYLWTRQSSSEKFQDTMIYQ